MALGTEGRSTGANGRAAMLARLVAHVRAHGLPADTSLRQFARDLGTSHRMLAYYFGTREQLLATVLLTMRSQERDMVASTPAEVARAMWAYYTDDDRRPEHQAFFYVLAMALADPGAYREFLDSFRAWTALLPGLEPATAQLLVASIRGLLMERLVADHPETVDAAFELLVDQLIGADR